MPGLYRLGIALQPDAAVVYDTRFCRRFDKTWTLNRETKMSYLRQVTLMLVVVGLLAVTALGQADPVAGVEEFAVADAPAEPGAEFSIGRAIALIGATLAAALAAIGGGYCLARIGSTCIDSMARQPEASGSMFAPMFVTAAMVEGGMLFGIVVCMMAERDFVISFPFGHQGQIFIPGLPTGLFDGQFMGLCIRANVFLAKMKRDTILFGKAGDKTGVSIGFTRAEIVV